MKNIFKSILTGLLITLFVCLMIWGMSDGAQHELDHNAEQIAECRRLGGFAMTNSDGWLRDCKFPLGTR